MNSNTTGNAANCSAYGNKKIGIYAPGGTVTGCTATDNGSTATAANFNGAGISAPDGLVSNCNAHHNYQNGIYAPNGFVVNECDGTCNPD